MTAPFTLHLGDCIEVLRGLPDSSVDAVVTDPPYGLSSKPDMAEVLRHWLAGDDYQHKGSGFMGKTWDSFVPGPAVWREALRVLKPGGHLLAFFGSRTYDMGTLALRLAGFEVRDQIMWVYSSGFPKSLDVSKAIDKAEDYKLQAAVRRAAVAAVQAAGLALPGNSRHDWTVGEHAPGDKWWAEFQNWLPGLTDEQRERVEGAIVTTIQKAAGWFTSNDIYTVRAPATNAAAEWSGWGTVLKPAHEPICVARKPLVGTVAANVLAHGTGVLNIDGCRVGWPDGVAPEIGTPGWGGPAKKLTAVPGQEGETVERAGPSQLGRWPANLIHDGSDDVLAAFPDAKGQQGALTGDEPSGKMGAANCYGKMDRRHAAEPRREEDRSAARFFYCAKASKSDRGEGNTHPTVKPTELMRYLVRLVTPPGGLVLDPFMGSGSTGKACMREGFRFVGIDMTPEYVDIARARIEHEHARAEAARAPKPTPAPAPQMDLFATLDGEGSAYGT